MKGNQKAVKLLLPKIESNLNLGNDYLLKKTIRL